MKYIKELDSLRAIAVLLVIVSHWISYSTPLLDKILHYCGPMGVDTFFVLSGFLITWILLDNRKKITEHKASRKEVLKNFYIRRTLRIFPIYYLVIILVLIFKDSASAIIHTAYPFLLTYTSNFYFFGLGRWEPIGTLSHMWSLAVEEQFYLIWPSLMLFVNRKYLVPVIIAFIATGIISQLLLSNNVMGNVLPFSCFDSFGLGALLAWQLVFYPNAIPVFYKRVRTAAIIALVFFIAAYVQTTWDVMPLFRTIISILALFTITYIIHKRTTGKLAFDFIWNNRILIFIGKISYGIYLYHNFIPNATAGLLQKYFHRTAVDLLPHKLGYIVMLGVNAVILLLVSWLSWIIIERPVLGLKKYFEYRYKEMPAAVVAAGSLK